MKVFAVLLRLFALFGFLMAIIGIFAFDVASIIMSLVLAGIAFLLYRYSGKYLDETEEQKEERLKEKKKTLEEVQDYQSSKEPTKQNTNSKTEKEKVKSSTKPQQNKSPYTLEEQEKKLYPLYEEIAQLTGDGRLTFGRDLINIDYVDRKGGFTNRDILVYEVRDSDYSQGSYIKAHCLLKDEQRYFNVDNVQKAYVNDEEVDLIDYLVETYKSSNTYATIKALIEHKSKIEALNYIAILDGRFQKKEKLTIAEYLKELDENTDTDKAIDYINEIRPDSKYFRKVVKTLPKGDERFKEVALQLAGKDEMKISAANMIQ